MSATMSLSRPAPTRRIPAGVINILRSVLINIVGPSLLYRVVQGWFPPDSAGPLLVCTLIPIADLAIVFARQRVVDVIAIIAIVQLGVGVGITLATHDLRLSLALHALQAGALGLVFAGSLLVRRPLIRAFARQSMAGRDAEKLAAFDARTNTPRGRRVFAVMTLIWAVALIGQSALLVLASRRMTPDDYITLHSILGYGLNGGLTWACIAYGRRRMRRAPAVVAE